MNPPHADIAPAPSSAPDSQWVDRLGTGIGIACAVHCLVTPLALGVLPFVGLGWLGDEKTELCFVGAAVLTAIIGGLWGLKQHRAVRVVATFAAAVALVLAGLWLGHESILGRAMTIGGGLTIAITHWFNARLCRSCHHTCCGEHEHLDEVSAQTGS